MNCKEHKLKELAEEIEMVKIELTLIEDELGIFKGGFDDPAYSYLTAKHGILETELLSLEEQLTEVEFGD